MATADQLARQAAAAKAAAELARQRAAADRARNQPTIATPRSEQGRRDENWNQLVHDYRANKNNGGGQASAPAPAASAPAGPVQRAADPTVKAVPLAMAFPPPTTYEPVKAAPIDTVLFVDESFSQEFITDLLFEDVAGQELLSIARDDTVNGQQVIYQPIKNLGILRDTYDINNLLKLQETSDRFFANFIINLFEKIPRVGNGPDGKNYYFDEVTGDGVIEFVNMRPDEQVEIEISNAGIIEELGI